MAKVENLYATSLNNLGPEFSPALDEGLSDSEKNFHFAMSCNGYFKSPDGSWKFVYKTVEPYIEEFQGQRASFFGPGTYMYGNYADHFYTIHAENAPLISQALNQPEVKDVIGKFRIIDVDEAARIAFILGGQARLLSIPASTLNSSLELMKKSISFTSKMTSLGQRATGDAIASTMSMYSISGGSLSVDNQFSRDVYDMAEAIKLDPIKPKDTVDLGISQIARLRAFRQLNQSNEPEPFPNISEEMEAFQGFPTVGAEFHFPKTAPKEFPDLWKRLALLNLSQYQRGSFIQMSRNDRDVIEVRMNPSVYPVTVSNWNYIREIFPEVNEAYFTSTINRRETEDFAWKNDSDKNILEYLRAIGMLSYAITFDNSPEQPKKEEVDFGTVYLGQTVKLQSDGYKFTGSFGSGEGDTGQMGVYTGYGKNFPYLSFYLSNVLKKPELVKPMGEGSLLNIKTLDDALSLSPSQRIGIFGSIQRQIFSDRDLFAIYKSGNRIMEKLDP